MPWFLTVNVKLAEDRTLDPPEVPPEPPEEPEGPLVLVAAAPVLADAVACIVETSERI